MAEFQRFADLISFNVKNLLWRHKTTTKFLRLHVAHTRILPLRMSVTAVVTVAQRSPEAGLPMNDRIGLSDGNPAVGTN